MFVAMGLSAVFPVLHGCSMFGVAQLEKQIGLSWLVTQGLLYILGAMIYAVSALIYMLCSTDELMAGLTFFRSGSGARAMEPRRLRHMGQFAPDLPCSSGAGGGRALGRAS